MLVTTLYTLGIEQLNTDVLSVVIAVLKKILKSL